METNTIICGDCQEEMAKLPDESIDMVFVDPPYGKDGIYLYEVIAKESARILKPGKFAVFYASDYWFDKVFVDCLKHLDFFYLFHLLNKKGHSSVFPRKIFQSAKTIMVFSKRKPIPNKWVVNLLQTPKEKSHRKDNWEQSVDDAKFFIDAYSNEGDIILDPNMGSGTTCVAAKQLERNYIGIELSEEHCKTAERRLNERLTKIHE